MFLGLVKAFPVQIDRTGGDLIFFGSLETKGLPTWVMLPFVFLAVAAIMTMIAHGVAQRFQKFSALEAYRLDIIGSLSGIVAYSLLAYFRVPPVGWMLVIAILIIVLDMATARARRRRRASAIVLGRRRRDGAAGLTIWSQYYRVQYFAEDRVRSASTASRTRR